MMTINQCADCLNNPSQRSNIPPPTKVIGVRSAIRIFSARIIGILITHKTKKRRVNKQKEKRKIKKKDYTFWRPRRRREMMSRGTTQIVSIISFLGLYYCHYISCRVSPYTLFPCYIRSVCMCKSVNCRRWWFVLFPTWLTEELTERRSTCWQDKDTHSYYHYYYNYTRCTYYYY